MIRFLLRRLSWSQPISQLSICLFLFFGFQAIVVAQVVVTSDVFFKNTFAELDRLSSTSSQNRNFRPSWLEEIDIRTESDEFDLDRQRFLIRLSPSTSKIRKAQTQLHQLYQSGANLERDQWRNPYVEAAYLDWLDIYAISKTLVLQQTLLVILLDQQKITQKLALVAQASIKDVIEIQQAVNEIQIEIFEQEQQLALMNLSSDNLDFSDLISLASIRQKTQVPTTVANQAFDQELAQEIQILDAEIQLELAEKRRFFDFMQVEYNGPSKDVWREKVSLGLAFTLPLSSNQKLKIEELSIEKELKTQESIIDTKQTEDKIKDGMQTLELLFKKFDFAKSLYEESNRKNAALVESSSPEAMATPLRQLYQKRLAAKTAFDLFKIEKEIYEAYIQVLDWNGSLYQEPFVNYLKE